MNKERDNDMEKVVDCIISDLAMVTNTEQEKLIYQCLSRIYLPNHTFMKEIVKSLYCGQLSLNMAYAKVFSYAKKHCHEDIDGIVLFFLSVRHLLSDDIILKRGDREYEYFMTMLYPELDLDMQSFVSVEPEQTVIHAGNMLRMIMQDWENLSECREMYKFIAFCCSHDREWNCSAANRTIFMNQMIGLSDQLSRKEKTCHGE